MFNYPRNSYGFLRILVWIRLPAALRRDAANRYRTRRRSSSEKGLREESVESPIAEQQLAVYLS